MLESQIPENRAVRVRVVETPATTLRALVQDKGLGPYALVSDIEGSETGFIFAEPGEFDGCEQILIELHGISYEGQFYSHDDLAVELARRHGFKAIDQHGAVFFFERDPEAASA